MKRICFIVFFICGFTFSQNLEEQIYNATEVFIANQNDHSYQRLVQQEIDFKNQAKSQDEQLALVFLQCNKAFYLKESNRLKTAISTYEEAWKRYNDYQLSTISDYDIIDYCLKPLGNLYTKTNNYTNAENTIQQYISLAKKGKNKEQYIAGIINLSALYQTRGMHPSVLELVAKAERISEISITQKEKLNSLKAFSSLSLKNTNDKDLTLQQNMPTIETPFQKHRMAYQMALKNEDYVMALEQFKLSKQFQKEELLTIRELAKRHVEEAQLYYLVHEFQTADSLLDNSIKLLLPSYEDKKFPEKSHLYAENTFIDIFDLKARLQTQSENALDYYDLSFYVANMLASNLTSQESKLANLIGNRKRSEWCIDLLFNDYEKHPNPEFLKRALNYAEKDKAAVLQEVFQKKSLLSLHPNDSLLLQEHELLKEQERLTDVLIKTKLGYQSPQNDPLNKQLLEVSIALKTVAQAINDTYGNTQNKTIDFVKLDNQLKLDQAALVVYFYGNNALYQFEISPSAHTFLKIKVNSEFTKTITDFIHLFDNASVINNNVQNFTFQASELYKTLGFDHVFSQPNLIIIPDGLLNFIPFDALLTESTETTNFTKMPFLVTSKNIVYNSNVNFYLQEQSKATDHQILGVFPVFENSNQVLTYSVNEADAIKKVSKAMVLMHDDANKAEFIKRAPDYNILHLSTHAAGGDFINPANIAFYDESMLVNELYSLDLEPELVVLSACETGIGKLQKGEGAMSIARGFQYAGAKNVLFSLWQINDASTATLMSLFYKSYDKTKSAHLANRQSKLDYLQNTSVSTTKKSPYYWSAFVYYGKIENNETNGSFIYYFIGIVALVNILFLWFRKRKRRIR